MSSTASGLPPASSSEELSSRRRVRKAVIPAAGHGTRLMPLTRSQPKEMVACGPAPVIGYVLEELKSAGITEVLLISSERKPVLEDFVLESWPGACVLRQPRQEGLGHAVGLAQDWVGQESFVVALGDTIIHSALDQSPLARMIAWRTRPQASGEGSLVLVRPVAPDRVNRYGIVQPLKDSPVSGSLTSSSPESGDVFPLKDIIEKPEPEHAPSNLAIAGRYLFSPAIFGALASTSPSRNGEIQLTDAMTTLCGTPGGLSAMALRSGEQRFDIGNFDSFYEAFAALSQQP